MPIKLLLPGGDQPWPLPTDWTDAHLRFAWNAAREEKKELRIEIEGHAILTLYPAEIPWYAITDIFDRCPETTAAFTRGVPLRCDLERDHTGAHEFGPASSPP